MYSFFFRTQNTSFPKHFRQRINARGEPQRMPISFGTEKKKFKNRIRYL